VSINTKNKGNRVEREIVNILNERFGDGIFSRVPSSGAIQGGKNYNPNLRKDATEILSGDLIVPKNFIFSIEVKSRKDFNFFDFFNKGAEIHKWLDQCSEDAVKSGKIPLLIIKINYHETFVMSQVDFMPEIFIYKNWKIQLLKEFLKNEDNVFFT
jgi:Holliday junction resolvase